MRSFAEAGNNYVTTLIDSFMLGWERSGRTDRDNRNSPGKHDLNLIAGICFFPLSYSRHRDHYVGMCRYRDVNVNIILRISPFGYWDWERAAPTVEWSTSLHTKLLLFYVCDSMHIDHYAGMCRYRDVNVNIILRISPFGYWYWEGAAPMVEWSTSLHTKSQLFYVSYKKYILIVNTNSQWKYYS